MRPLTEDETRTVFEKLAKFIGKNIKTLVDPPNNDDPYCFRVQKDRVYYVTESRMRMGLSVARGSLASIGTCLGKFTHGGNFHVHITALEVLAPLATYKIWIKSSSEMSFLYGNHVLKAGLGRITENTPANQGVVVFNMADLPMGFGMTARSTVDCRKANPTDIVVLNQADIGLYLRDEDRNPASAL